MNEKITLRVLNISAVLALMGLTCFCGITSDAKNASRNVAEETAESSGAQVSASIASILTGSDEEALLSGSAGMGSDLYIRSDNEECDVIPEETDESDEDSEYANFAIAQVNAYVNVRNGAGTSFDVVGKMYNGSVAEILETTTGEDGEEWYRIKSGNVEGYIKAEFFIAKEAALSVIDDYITRYATVSATRLNVRKEASVDSDRIGYLDNGEKVELVEDLGDWMLVRYTGEKTGYVSAEYVTLSEEYITAKSLEEEAAELARAKELQERQKADESTSKEDVTIVVQQPDTSYTTNAELRSAIIEYAMQFLGNKYVHGGQSLASGTDCSGFTCYVLKEFGINISRTPSGQLSVAGRSISTSEMQPGDIICYGKSRCTHVAFYIGNGQILHSANSRKGVIIGDAYYNNILGVKNVID